MLVDKRLYRTSAVLLIDERLRNYSAVLMPHSYNCAVQFFKVITLTSRVPLRLDRNTKILHLLKPIRVSLIYIISTTKFKEGNRKRGIL